MLPIFQSWARWLGLSQQPVPEEHTIPPKPRKRIIRAETDGLVVTFEIPLEQWNDIDNASQVAAGFVYTTADAEEQLSRLAKQVSVQLRLGFSYREHFFHRITIMSRCLDNAARLINSHIDVMRKDRSARNN